jgi:hypothetical protein
VNIEGLRALGNVCRREAEQLAAGHSDPLVGPRFQPSTAALDNAAAVTRRAGFDVEDDLTLVDATPSSASARKRKAIALHHAESIWRAADGLVATDRTVGRTLSEALKLLEVLRFPEEPSDAPGIFSAAFGGSSPPLPAAPHLIYCYPSARPDFWWCEGCGGWRRALRLRFPNRRFRGRLDDRI